MTYSLEVAGLKRELPICKVTDDLYIGAFICFGDAELTVACARELLKLVPADSYDYMFTAEAKSIPLIHEMARQSGAKKYFLARKSSKIYMKDPICVEISLLPLPDFSGCIWGGMMPRCCMESGFCSWMM